MIDAILLREESTRAQPTEKAMNGTIPASLLLEQGPRDESCPPSL